MQRDDTGSAALPRQAQRLDTLAAVARPVQHDLNNLLTVIFANLDLLKRHVVEEVPQRRLGRVQEAARRFEASTRAVLSLARRSVPGETVMAPAKAVAVLQPLLELLLPHPGALEVEAGPPSPECRFDQSLLDEALIGLARGSAGRGTLRVAVAGAEGGALITLRLPAAALAAEPAALEALRALAAGSGGSLAEETGGEAASLRLALPAAPV